MRTIKRFELKSVIKMPRIGILFGVLAIVILPILFALMGALMGGASAYIYNVVASYVGGILVEVE